MSDKTNLLDFYREHREQINALVDPTALFVLTFVNEIGRTTRATLQSELALAPVDLSHIIDKLNRAELLGTQGEWLHMTPSGQRFLQEIGLSNSTLSPPSEPPT